MMPLYCWGGGRGGVDTTWVCHREVFCEAHRGGVSFSLSLSPENRD
jgi:hypothetical protein